MDEFYTFMDKKITDLKLTTSNNWKTFGLNGLYTFKDKKKLKTDHI